MLITHTMQKLQFQMSQWTRHAMPSPAPSPGPGGLDGFQLTDEARGILEGWGDVGMPQRRGARVLDRVLAGRDSPLAGYGGCIQAAADRHRIDPLLLLAFLGHETDFGRQTPGGLLGMQPRGRDPFDGMAGQLAGMRSLAGGRPEDSLASQMRGILQQLGMVTMLLVMLLMLLKELQGEAATAEADAPEDAPVEETEEAPHQDEPEEAEPAETAPAETAPVEEPPMTVDTPVENQPWVDTPTPETWTLPPVTAPSRPPSAPAAVPSAPPTPETAPGPTAAPAPPMGSGLVVGASSAGNVPPAPPDNSTSPYPGQIYY